MLVAAIICTIMELVLYLFMGIGMAFSDSLYTWLFVLGIIGCFVTCLISMINGIRGIKDRSIRGRSIATTAVGALGTLMGSIIVPIAIALALGFEMINNDVTFEGIRLLLNSLYMFI